jgi:hypothetical protein
LYCCNRSYILSPLTTFKCTICVQFIP